MTALSKSVRRYREMVGSDDFELTPRNPQYRETLAYLKGLEAEFGLRRVREEVERQKQASTDVERKRA